MRKRAIGIGISITLIQFACKKRSSKYKILLYSICIILCSILLITTNLGWWNIILLPVCTLIGTFISLLILPFTVKEAVEITKRKAKCLDIYSKLKDDDIIGKTETYGIEEEYESDMINLLLTLTRSNVNTTKIIFNLYLKKYCPISTITKKELKNHVKESINKVLMEKNIYENFAGESEIIYKEIFNLYLSILQIHEEIKQKSEFKTTTRETVIEPTSEKVTNFSQYLGDNYIQISLPKEVSDKVSEIMDQEKIDFWKALEKINKEDNSIEGDPNLGIFTDPRDGNVYKTVKIGKQVWMTENLNVDKFQNGDLIPEAKTDEEWEKAGENKQPAWCYYNNNPDNGDRYGKLYNWYAVNDPRGLAPKGWKVPSDEDWSRLTDFLGGESVAGKKMKFTDFWADNDGQSGHGTNESGFLGLPGGSRRFDGNFDSVVGKSGYWWSSTEYDTYVAWRRAMYYNYGNVNRADVSKKNGESVRCVKDTDTYNNMGNSYDTSDNDNQAITCLQKSISIDPNDANEYYNMGNSYNKSGNYEKAITYYEKTISINPNHANAYNNMGVSYEKLGNDNHAITCYQKAISINPNHADVYYNMGVSYNNLGNYNQAITCYKKAISIDPNYVNAYYSMGNSYRKLGNYNQAITYYQKAISINPNDAEAYLNMGVSYEKLGNYNQAITYYQKAISINPNYADVYYNMGNSYDEFGNYNQAITCYQKAIAINPNDDKGYYNMGLSYNKLGNHNQAITCYQKAIAINPNFAEAYFNMAISYAKLDNHNQATTCFQKAARLGDKNAQNALKEQGLSW
jgi:uncharacterized protein (TIGR02145 family)